MTRGFVKGTREDEIFSYLRNSVNTFVYGNHGIGKTGLIRKVAKKVSDRLGHAVYVDCSLYQTANAVLREALISIGSVIASKSNYDLTKRLKEKTKKLRVYVFLDHFERLKNHDILNILSGLNFCVCLVANSPESHRLLNNEHRAKFANIVRIERLPDDKVFELLMERSSANVSKAILRDIVEKSKGNLTLALNTLRSFEANPRKMKLFEQVDTYDLNEDYSVILALLKEHKILPSGKLYDLYCQRSDFHKGGRSFRNFMQSLCKQGLVKSIGDKRGRAYQIIETRF
ncbi:MAG: hypothetical protein NWF01_05220 [Candidatus Bathyarchaeota archaeon]|nr:hypothetical protein [Candidatus Bathyarchaeota archaeon]